MKKTLNAISTMALISIFFMTIVHAESEFKLINGVIELNEDNWDKAIAKHENLLITFYAPWW